MIIIPAKLKCDHYDCEMVVDIEITVSEGDRNNHNIPEIEVASYPKGWGSGPTDWKGDCDKHCCPLHKGK